MSVYFFCNAKNLAFLIIFFHIRIKLFNMVSDDKKIEKTTLDDLTEKINFLIQKKKNERIALRKILKGILNDTTLLEGEDEEEVEENLPFETEPEDNDVDIDSLQE